MSILQSDAPIKNLKSIVTVLIGLVPGIGILVVMKSGRAKVVVDNQALVRDGLKLMIDLEDDINVPTY